MNDNMLDIIVVGSVSKSSRERVIMAVCADTSMEEKHEDIIRVRQS